MGMSRGEAGKGRTHSLMKSRCPASMCARTLSATCMRSRPAMRRCAGASRCVKSWRGGGGRDEADDWRGRTGGGGGEDEGAVPPPPPVEGKSEEPAWRLGCCFDNAAASSAKERGASAVATSRVVGAELAKG